MCLGLALHTFGSAVARIIIDQPQSGTQIACVFGGFALLAWSRDSLTRMNKREFQ